MAMDATDYAISKDVRNTLIVREVDETRQRRMRNWVLVALLLVAVALAAAWQQFELLRYGYRIERMQQDRAAEEEISRRLRLEIETLRSPERIEQLATERLNMVAPRPDQAIVIERIVPPDPPPSSVVAAR
jgi:cell division protein FtsL